MRHFYCRDVLWETFEQMANDFDCSIDYLVNESMRYYARSKNYALPNPGNPGVTGNPVAPGPAASQPQAQMGGAMTSQAGGAMKQRSAPPSSSPLPARRQPAPTPGGYQRPANGAASSGSPAPVPVAAGAGAVAGAGPTLFLLYNGQRYPVTKDQFIIGRGSKTSDLAIKDGNISRKHAAVIRRNGTFYIKDLGSTNGIDYKGMRIDNKRIDEGDIFHLCDYELRFSYRQD
ncbi:MAG: FHA domain-containing protein [Myxococcales bacterium]|nr:FHA domain-containing protein [Myxococcales bacterium]